MGTRGPPISVRLPLPRAAEPEGEVRRALVGVPGAVVWFLRLPLALKLVGANVLLLLAAVASLWALHRSAGAWGVLAVAALALAVGTTLNLLLVTLALRPLHALEGTARRVWSGELEARVPPSRIADPDLARVGRTLNLLLDRLLADRARLRALAGEVIRRGDRERAALARELHDSTAQSLAGLVYQLRAAEQSATEAAVREQLAAIREAATTVLEEVRLLSHTVHPRVLDDLGLASALRHLARTTQAHSGVPIDVDVSPAAEAVVPDLPPELASVLYYVGQEAVRNALRHARPGRITLRLTAGSAELSLAVVDDGTGFVLDEAERRRPGMGLFTMRERASLVDGELDVITAPGRGTTVCARVPVDHPVSTPGHDEALE
jgi:signal transduction histidine kinase